MSPGGPRLWVLRHGQSTANVEGRIVSAHGPEALERVGLTELGLQQARDAGERAAASGALGPQTLVITSDFARARQTAEEFAAALDAAEPVADARLRERCFGLHDGGPDTAYAQVWEADVQQIHPGENVETVTEVAARVRTALDSARERAREEGAPDAVLVAHGDVLQIALIIAAGRAPHEHRDQTHLANAELRELPWPPQSPAAPPTARTER